jgi:simple sugar transport system permease protein
VAAIAVYVFFVFVASGNAFVSAAGTASWMNVSAELGIVSVPVALLMVAGEFDLSIGSTVGAATMVVAIGSGVEGWPLWLSVLLALALGLGVGVGNGLLTVRTGLPSFIVTLAANFMLLGAALGLSQAIAGTTTVSVDASGWIHGVFASHWKQFHVSIVWWCAISLIAAWVLARTRFGNWVAATGGNLRGARAAGVPTNRVKICLFAATGLGAALVGVIQAIEFGSGTASNGQGFVFEAPIVAVIGGVLLTGGYGSMVGVFLGAAIYGIVGQGIFYTGWDTNWVQLFIGGLLLLAVLANNWFRKLALRMR